MDQCYVDLLGAIARQAVHDLHTGYTHPRHMDAGAWLEAAGLLEQAQTNGPVRRAQRNRRSTAHDNHSSLESAWPEVGRADSRDEWLSCAVLLLLRCARRTGPFVRACSNRPAASSQAPASMCRGWL